MCQCIGSGENEQKEKAGEEGVEWPMPDSLTSERNGTSLNVLAYRHT